MGAGVAQPAVSLSEAQAYVRIETGEEEAVLAGLIRTASAVCESFLNQVVIARDLAVDMPVSPNWQRLPVTPVRAIVQVEAIDSFGHSHALPSHAYSVDIDSEGYGWVRVTDPQGCRRVRLNCVAGIAEEQNGVPEPIRQGVIRLAAHLFASRDGPGQGPPAAVTALWRPYRRMQLR